MKLMLKRTPTSTLPPRKEAYVYIYIYDYRIVLSTLVLTFIKAIDS
jgi:hypothetical protein